MYRKKGSCIITHKHTCALGMGLIINHFSVAPKKLFAVLIGPFWCISFDVQGSERALHTVKPIKDRESPLSSPAADKRSETKPIRRPKDSNPLTRAQARTAYAHILLLLHLKHTINKASGQTIWVVRDFLCAEHRADVSVWGHERQRADKRSRGRQLGESTSKHMKVETRGWNEVKASETRARVKIHLTQRGSSDEWEERQKQTEQTDRKINVSVQGALFVVYDKAAGKYFIRAAWVCAPWQSGHIFFGPWWGEIRDTRASRPLCLYFPQ